MASPYSWLEKAREIQAEADLASIGRAAPGIERGLKEKLTPVMVFDIVVTNQELRSASRELFLDGHYARAVEEAFKCLNNAVKAKSGIFEEDGARLMRKVLSANSPLLRLNSLQTQSERDEQLGYMDLFAGSMTGIRNPRAHEHSLTDEVDVALEMLVFANHLMRKLEIAV